MLRQPVFVDSVIYNLSVGIRRPGSAASCCEIRDRSDFDQQRASHHFFDQDELHLDHFRLAGRHGAGFQFRHTQATFILPAGRKQMSFTVIRDHGVR
jgi:hypothetical protein